MKTRVFSFLALSIIFSLVLSVLVFALVARSEKAVNTDVRAKEKCVSVLLAGLDEAGENTDVLMLLSVYQNGAANILQIPRDTFIKSEFGEGKINHLYSLYTQKYGKKSGADRFLTCLSEAFDVPIRLYAVFTGDSLASLVDTVGGVTLTVPYAFEYTDKNGQKSRVGEGKQTLSGEKALAYVRHRASYAEGDLGRLNAQLRFLAALIEEVFEEKSVRAWWQIYQKNYRNLLTNAEEKDIINLITVYLKNKDDLTVRLMRLPGEACRDTDGTWYYVLNKNGAAFVLGEYFSGGEASAFDREGRFVKENREVFTNIYGAKDYECRIYTPKEAAEAEVLHK